MSVTPANPSSGGPLAASVQIMNGLNQVLVAQSKTLRGNEELIRKQGEALNGLEKGMSLLQRQVAQDKQDAKERDRVQEAQAAAMNTLLMTLQGLLSQTTASSPQPSAVPVPVDLAEEADTLCRTIERYPIRFGKDLSTAPDKQAWLVATEELILSLAKKQVSKDVPLNTDCVAYWQSVGGLSDAQIQVLQNFSLSSRAFQNYDDLRKADPSYDAKGVLLQKVDAMRIDRKVFTVFKKHYLQGDFSAALRPHVQQVLDAAEKELEAQLLKKYPGAQGSLTLLTFWDINHPMQDMSASGALGHHPIDPQPMTQWISNSKENHDLYLAEVFNNGHFVLGAKFEEPRVLKVSILFDAHDGAPPWLCQEERSLLDWEAYRKKVCAPTIGSPTVTIPKDPALDAKRAAIRDLNVDKLSALRRVAKERLEQNPAFVDAARPLAREYAFIEQLSNMLGFDKSWLAQLKAVHTCNTEDPEHPMIESGEDSQWTRYRLRNTRPEAKKTSALLKE